LLSLLFFALLPHDSLYLKRHILEQKRFCRRDIQGLSLRQQCSHQIVEDIRLGEINGNAQESGACLRVALPRFLSRSTSTSSTAVCFGLKLRQRSMIRPLQANNFPLRRKFSRCGSTVKISRYRTAPLYQPSNKPPPFRGSIWTGLQRS